MVALEASDEVSSYREQPSIGAGFKAGASVVSWAVVEPTEPASDGGNIGMALVGGGGCRCGCRTHDDRREGRRGGRRRHRGRRSVRVGLNSYDYVGWQFSPGDVYIIALRCYHGLRAKVNAG